MPLDPAHKYAFASKPLLWSNNGYRGPSDPKVHGGWVKEAGYGGEEWNGDSTREWQRNRYFSSETEKKLDAFAEHGHLGLLMTAMKGDVQYILGVACDVSLISSKEYALIEKRFTLAKVGDELWNRPTIREKFASRSDFTKHWGSGTHTIHWKCPAELYEWFDEPIPLPKYPLRPDKMVLSKMHGGYQALRPEDGIKLLGDRLAEDHPIMQWLITNDFDPFFFNPVDRKVGAPLSKKERSDLASAAAADKPYKKYLKERVVTVNALHGVLEKEFASYLSSIKATDIRRNVGGIDACFTLAKVGPVIAELKPASKDETRFALRIAIGQVLEYQYFLRPDAKPLIVLGYKPTPKEIKFAGSLGISCAWKTANSFEIAWADSSS
jgi:hypothetical protein